MGFKLMRKWSIFALLAGVLWAGAAMLRAQEPTPIARSVIPADVCAAPLAVSVLAASDACVGKPYGFICNGGASPQVEPAGPVANSLAAVGALVETDVVTSIRTLGIDPTGYYMGIAYLRVAAPESLVTFSGLLLGDVQVKNVTPPNFPAWQAIEVITTDADVACEYAPHSTLILQNPVAGVSSRLVVNGVSIDLNGTLAVQTQGDYTVFAVLSGEMRALALGQRQTLTAGQSTSAPHAPDNFSAPTASLSVPRVVDEERTSHLPLALFDRPVQIAQGGFARTTAPVNLRVAPSTEATVILQVGANENMSVLGKNPAGDWLHVRLPSGQTGWMFAELLQGDFASVAQTYEATPAPVQRLGDLGYRARIIAPRGFDVRTAPDAAFPVLGFLANGAEVELIARSPYSPWVKIKAGDSEGWVALLSLETRAVIEALPVDTNVPPPPAPTRVPGSFGNAFPDPNCYPNC